MTPLQIARAALEKAEQKFLFYAEQHAAKGTSDADIKALVNTQMAADMREAIDATRSDRTAMLGQEAFADWFRKNYPGPDTVIYKPDWHAPKIFRAVVAAIDAAQPATIAFERPGGLPGAEMTAGEVRAWNAAIEAAAGVAKTAWVSADYNVVGIADADMALRLCEHSETAIRTLAKPEGGA